MNGQPELYKVLKELAINYDYYEHPPVPTVEEASRYWVDIEAAHCKNIFFRNHRGNRHYLVVLDYREKLNIDNLVKLLKQGKLSFASEKRLKRYLGVLPGSVSPFGIINDEDNHTTVFLDKNLERYDRISFHPNENTASLVVGFSDFLKFLKWSGNPFEFIKLY